MEIDNRFSNFRIMSSAPRGGGRTQTVPQNTDHNVGGYGNNVVMGMQPNIPAPQYAQVTVPEQQQYGNISFPSNPSIHVAPQTKIIQETPQQYALQRQGPFPSQRYQPTSGQYVMDPGFYYPQPFYGPTNPMYPMMAPVLPYQQPSHMPPGVHQTTQPPTQTAQRVRKVLDIVDPSTHQKLEIASTSTQNSTDKPSKSPNVTEMDEAQAKMRSKIVAEMSAQLLTKTQTPPDSLVSEPQEVSLNVKQTSATEAVAAVDAPRNGSAEIAVDKADEEVLEKSQEEEEKRENVPSFDPSTVIEAEMKSVPEVAIANEEQSQQEAAPSDKADEAFDSAPGAVVASESVEEDSSKEENPEPEFSTAIALEFEPQDISPPAEMEVDAEGTDEADCASVAVTPTPSVDIRASVDEGEVSADLATPSVADEDAEKSEEEDDAAERESQLLAKRDALSQDPNEVDLERMIYGRAFLYCVRDLEKEFQHNPCPLTQAELDKLGVDVRSMPKIERKKDGFFPSWVKNPSASSSRPKFSGRPSGNRDRRYIKGVGSRTSTDKPPRVELSNRAKDAWKPDKLKGGSGGEKSEAERLMEVLKNFRSLMNKITPTTKDALISDFLKLNVTMLGESVTKEVATSQCEQVVNIMFDKAVEEPRFCPLYSEVCTKQVEHEVQERERLSGERNQSLFRTALLTRAQQTFMVTDQEEQRAPMLKAIEDESDSAKKRKLEEELIEFDQTCRRRKFGNITFIGQLFVQKLLNVKIIRWCIQMLMKDTFPVNGKLPDPPYDEEMLHCAIRLLENVGKHFDIAGNESKEYIRQLLEHCSAIADRCPNKIRFMIYGLRDLAAQGWVSKKVIDQGPKKITEIHNEIKQEAIEKEQQHRRDDFRDRDRDRQLRVGGGSLRRNQPLPARNSLDSRYSSSSGMQQNRRAVAASATKLTNSTAQPRNMSLSAVTSGGPSGPTKKVWTSGSGGGGSSTDSSKRATTTRHAGREGSDERRKVDHPAKVNRTGSRNAPESPSPVEEITKDMLELRPKLTKSFKCSIDEIKDGSAQITDLVSDIVDYIGKDRYGKPDLEAVFFRFFEALFCQTNNPEQCVLSGKMLCTALTDSRIDKGKGITGIAQFCKYAIETDLALDYPRLWTIVAQIIIHSIYYEGEDRQKSHPVLKDFAPVFAEASLAECSKPYELFVTSLKLMCEENSRKIPDDHATSSSMEYSDLEAFVTKLDEEKLTEALKSCKPDVKNFSSLFEILHH